jgi:hypothetical protein
MYRFTLEAIASVIAALDAHNLTCNLSLPSRGDVWRDVNDQLSDHLKLAKIDLLSSSTPLDDLTMPGDPYFQSPMILIGPRSPRQWESRRFVQTDIVGGDFKIASLVPLANKVRNPCDGDDRPLLFFGM